MPLTFGRIREIVAPYAGRAGKDPTHPDVAVFARSVMQYMLYSGSHAGMRKLCILSVKGCVSLPSEVEVVLKARVDHRVAEVWPKWHSFHSVTEDMDRCLPAGEILIEDGTGVPFAYPLPEGGSVVGIMGSCQEDCGTEVTVQGKDNSGREVFTSFEGAQVVGERFRVKKNELRYGQTHFMEITAVSKPRTKGYVSLWAVNPSLGKKRFLADYSPQEEHPYYRTFRVISRECTPLHHLTLLCRVRVKDNYDDNEVVFFDNDLGVMLAAQAYNAERNNEAQVADYKDKKLGASLESESGYKKKSGNVIDVFQPLSAGTIRNIVNGRLY